MAARIGSLKNLLPSSVTLVIGPHCRDGSVKTAKQCRHLSTGLLVRQQYQAAEQRANQHQHQTQKVGTMFFQGNAERPIKAEMDFIEPRDIPTVPAFRVLNPDGSLINGACVDPSLSVERVLEIYKDMILLNTLDKVMFDSHRQGRISFYMTNFGEEAVSFGSVSALDARDWIFAQYREAGVLVHRKMPIELLIAQLYGNREDLGKGRQMPIHYGNKAINYVTISSPLTVQMPQAVGTAYTFKHDGSGRVVLCYFGEGAASEGDAHAALNFAATLSTPVVFVCRNNGYAISTPVSDQYASDGIVHRALGYGMPALRVDGNDLLAVYAATREARRIATEQSRPVLLEAMTYRIGHHSTSDDSSAYRSMEEVHRWERNDSPIQRVQNYLMKMGVWNEERQEQTLKEARQKVIKALNWAEKQKKLPIDSMFEDVYDELPLNLQRQRDELAEHLKKYAEHYGKLDQFEPNESRTA